MMRTCPRCKACWNDSNLDLGCVECPDCGGCRTDGEPCTSCAETAREDAEQDMAEAGVLGPPDLEFTPVPIDRWLKGTPSC